MSSWFFHGVTRGVKKVERALCPMNSEVAWVDVIRFSVEFERRQNGTGQKVIENGGTAQQTLPDVMRPEWCGASEGRRS